MNQHTKIPKIKPLREQHVPMVKPLTVKERELFRALTLLSRKYNVTFSSNREAICVGRQSVVKVCRAGVLVQNDPNNGKLGNTMVKI